MPEQPLFQPPAGEGVVRRRGASKSKGHVAAGAQTSRPHDTRPAGVYFWVPDLPQGESCRVTFALAVRK